LDTSPVLRLDLSRNDLFTSNRPAELLVYAEDYDKAQWRPDEWDGFACRLLSLQQRIEAAGRTAFLFLLAPDKSTAYAAYLPPDPKIIDGYEILERDPRLHLPPLSPMLRAAIAAGTRDVYLPDDTHFGYAGTRLAARAVQQARRGLRPSTPPRAEPLEPDTQEKGLADEGGNPLVATTE
jgi:hypothetical protein